VDCVVLQKLVDSVDAYCVFCMKTAEHHWVVEHLVTLRESAEACASPQRETARDETSLEVSLRWQSRKAGFASKEDQPIEGVSGFRFSFPFTGNGDHNLDRVNWVTDAKAPCTLSTR
jgi:hypothetical protein